MAKFGEFIVVYNVLPEVAARMLETLDQIVRKAAFDISASAASQAPVDTGFLKNSIYVETEKESTYGDAGGGGDGSQEMLPEVEKPAKHQAVIAVGASYGLYVEMGSVHGPAQPYLTPAVEKVRPEYDHALALLEAQMAKVHIPTGDTSGGMGGVTGGGQS
jgi:HK97 gp10 family phage protein